MPTTHASQSSIVRNASCSGTALSGVKSISQEVVVNTSDINKNSIFTFFILCIILMYRKTPRNQLLIQ